MPSCRAKQLSLLLILALHVLSSERHGAAAQDQVFTLRFDGRSAPPRCLIPYRHLARRKVGLALSGGGLRGIAQIGVLKVLEENNIPIDCIVGSSIGAVVGGLYAAGYSPDQIWQIARSVDWLEALNDTPERSTLFLAEKQKRGRAVLQFRLDRLRPVLPEAFTPGQKLADILIRLVLNAPYHSPDFNRLRVPLRIVTTDLLSGEKVLIESGDLAEAMRASIAIPLLLRPVDRDNMLLADGGILDNIPVQEVKRFGADIVLAVDTSSPLRTREAMGAPWETADRVTTIMQQDHNRDQLQLADVSVSLRDIRSTSLDVGMLDSLYIEGQRRAARLLPALRNRLQDARSPDEPDFHVKRIAIRGALVRPDSVLGEFIDQPGILSAGSAQDEIQSDPQNTILNPARNLVLSRTEISNLLQRLYRSGYYSDVSARMAGGDLEVNLEQMPVLKSVSFQGTTLMPDSVLFEPFAPLLDRPVRHQAGVRALRKLITHYRTAGYSLARIAEIDFDRSSGRATVVMDEGVITAVDFIGLEKTKKHVVSREFSQNADDVFKLDRAHQGILNIFATGLFKSVTLKVIQQRDENVIQVQLVEKPSTLVRFGVRYDSERHGRTFVEFADENLIGLGNELTLHGSYGDRDLAFSTRFQTDRIFKTYLTANLAVHHEHSKHFAYESFRGVGEYERRASGTHISLGQQIERFGTIMAVLRFENIDIRTISGYGFDAGALLINTLGFRSLVDTRDQIPFPQSGRFHHFSYEVSSGTFLGADISYFKVQNQLASYWTLFRRFTLCPKVVWGTSDLTTPFSEQFRIGGEETFYGLREGEMQGRHMLLASLECRALLWRSRLLDLYIALRADVGAVWEKVVDVSAEDFINGRGAALQLKSPLGPFSIAYGRTGTGHDRLYVSAGYKF